MLFQLTPQALPEGYGDALLPLDAAKAWLRVDSDEEDAVIEALRDAAIEMVESYTSLFLAPRTGLVASFTGFGPGMRLGRGPDASVVVTGVDYLDAGGANASLDEEAWRVGVDGGLLPAIGSCWPIAGGAVTVTFDAGFAAGEAPSALISAAKLFLSFLFDNRGALVSEGLEMGLPAGFVAICSRWRMPVI